MWALILVIIAAIVGYRISVIEMSNPIFDVLPDSHKAICISIGMISSMAIVVCFLVISGAV